MNDSVDVSPVPAVIRSILTRWVWIDMLVSLSISKYNPYGDGFKTKSLTAYNLSHARLYVSRKKITLIGQNGPR